MPIPRALKFWQGNHCGPNGYETGEKSTLLDQTEHTASLIGDT